MFILIFLFFQVAKSEDLNLKEIQKIADQKKIDENFYRTFVEEYQIDLNYHGGSNFIYDCENRYYACVDTPSFNKCIEKRELNYSFSKSNELSCAPIKRFMSKEECVLYQYSVQERSPKLFFCYKKH